MLDKLREAIRGLVDANTRETERMLGLVEYTTPELDAVLEDVEALAVVASEPVAGQSWFSTYTEILGKRCYLYVSYEPDKLWHVSGYWTPSNEPIRGTGETYREAAIAAGLLPERGS